MKGKQNLPVLTEVEVVDAGAEGKAVARSGEMVVFIPFAAPGDIVDIQIVRKKKSFAEGRIIRFHRKSKSRIEPFCKHFGVCGGCKWQHLKYEEQLFFKQKQVEDNLLRIGKLDIPDINPIMPSSRILEYRNKLEFTFSNRKWLTGFVSSNRPEEADMRALGFHMPGMFDRVLDIETCYLQPEPSNTIRLAVREYALTHGYTFYDARKWEGFLRNLIIRNTLEGDFMVILVVNYADDVAVAGIMTHLENLFPQITSLIYVINEKRNDAVTDQDMHLYRGEPWLIETIPAFRAGPPLRFKISPVSFFQTNTMQAIGLYRTAASFAGLSAHHIVYDLFTGTGTIANYIARQVKRVVGIDSVQSSILDAAENARLNNINNALFFHGDIASILTDDFISVHGKPDIIITDPPRTGMHEKVVRQLLGILPERIVYISCNPATQARDLALLTEKYTVSQIQPVDMFPHTQHVENIALLVSKEITGCSDIL